MAANDLERMAPLLATYLVHSTFWLGGCAALLWLTRLRRPAVRHAAWKWSVVGGFATALAQYVLPVTSRSLDLTLVTMPVGRASEPMAPTAEVPLAPSVAGDESDVGQPASPSEAAPAHRNIPAGGETRLIEPPAETRLPTQAYRAGPSSNWLRAAMIVWAVVVGISLTRTLLAWRRLSRLGDLTELSTGKERELFDRLLAAANIRHRVRLFRSQSGTNPMAWGFWRWRIVVPGTLFERLDRRELRALLAHELAHLARGDTRWLCAWSVLGAVGFLQPLNRIAQRQIRRAAELLSDSWAVEATGDRLSLARALTKTAELRGRMAVPLASLAVASSSEIADRVDRLIGPDTAPADSPKGRWLTLIAGSTAITAAVVWLPAVKLVTARDYADGALPRLDEPVSPRDPIRALDRELDSLDLELDALRPLVTNARDSTTANQDVVEAWRAIERRRGRVREGHVRVRDLLWASHGGKRSPSVNP